MAVYQLLQTFAHGDAIGNETLSIKKILLNKGFKTGIYGLYCTPQLEKEFLNYRKLDNLEKDDLLIYHFAIGCRELCEFIKKINCKKIMLYHNITPSNFFEEYSKLFVEITNAGRQELLMLKDEFDYCWADSEYNKKELLDIGYRGPIDILPLIINFNDYDKALDITTLEKYANNDYVNILFVGRIAPNKKHEDVIRVFYYYKKYINSKARLIFVGNYDGMEKYYLRLLDYIKKLNLKDVIFTGHIPFNSILSYYNLADIFLCMSEHEGFCVPLIEAMYFDIPIIAYKSTAIPYVLGDAGIIVENKEPMHIANIIDRIIKSKELKNELISKQRKRLNKFTYEQTSEIFLNYLTKVMKVNNSEKRK